VPAEVHHELRPAAWRNLIEREEYFHKQCDPHRADDDAAWITSRFIARDWTIPSVVSHLFLVHNLDGKWAAGSLPSMRKKNGSLFGLMPMSGCCCSA
jgi:hypothetical protein